MSVGLGSVGVRLCCEVSLVQTFVGPMSFLTTKVASVVALVAQPRSGLALLEALDKGVGFIAGVWASWYRVSARSQISA